MPTVEEILGERQITVESILGRKPISMQEIISKAPIEDIDERQQFVSETIADISGERPSNISPYLKAIPPTLWEFTKETIPGTKLLAEEFKNTPWWSGRIGLGAEIPPEFDDKEWTIEELEELQREMIAKNPDKVQKITAEIRDMLSFYVFPKAMKLIGDLTGPPIQKYAPTVYKFLAKEIKFGKKPPAKMPEIGEKVEVKGKIGEVAEVNPEGTVSVGFPDGKIKEVKATEVKPIEFKEPPIVKYREEAREIESNLPPVEEGFTRMWRGNKKSEGVTGTKYTNDLPGIALPFRDAYGGRLTYTDVPTAELSKYELKVAAAEGAEFVLPEKYITKAKVIEERLPTFEEALAQSETKTARVREIQEKVLGPEPETPFESTVKYDPHMSMAEAGTESMVAKGIKRDPKKLMTEQLIDEWLEDPAKYQSIIAKYGMTPQEWAGLMREQASSWGRKLGELGLEAQRLGKEMPEIGEALAELEQIAKMPSAWDKIQTGWKNLDRVRRGLLVTQLSTATRNAWTQAGRVTMDVPEKAMDYYLAKLFGLQPKGSPMDGVEQLVKVLQRTESKKIAETVLSAFPKQQSRLYSTYMSDIEVGKTGQTISKGVDILNTANRFQEFLYRNGIFTSTLEQELKRQGMNLIEIIEKGAVSDIPRDAVKNAVTKALEMTFAETPKWGSIGEKFVSFVTSMPGATFLLPFPRFMVNSLKFNFEYSPLGMLKLLSASERAAFAAGDVHVMSRAIMGSIMLGVAYQIRNSDYAGEKWNEVKVGGKTVNMIAYNPFAVYLFVADVIKRANEGNLYQLTSKDISMGMLSSNIRAGTGLYAVDQIINGLSKTGDSEKAANVLKTFAGETIAGFLTPLNQIKEFISGFDDYIVKEKRSDPFWGAVKEKIPIVEKTLPVAYSPTRKDPIAREVPAWRQLTGMMITTKNSFEKEIDKLGFSYPEIFHSVGDPEADNLIKKYMGMMVETIGIPLIESNEFKTLSDGQKALVLADFLNEVRSTAREAAEEENPNLFARIKLEEIPKRQKIFLEEQGVYQQLEKQLVQ